MNTLSWFLYVADVIGGIGLMFGTIGGLLFLGGWIFAIPGYMVIWTVFRDQEEAAKKSKEAFAWLSPRMVIAGFLMITASVLVPSKQTMYMIAASEMGEVVVKSEEAKEIFGELKTTVIHELKRVRELKTEDTK